MWTDPQTETLKELWPKGLSAEVIASTLGDGITRNAVIGKVHRLGLPERPTTVRIDEPRQAELRKRRAESRLRTAGRIQREGIKSSASNNKGLGGKSGSKGIGPLPLPALPPLMRRLVDLNRTDCRFPIGDPLKTGFGFCGHEAADGSSWCPGHRAIATKRAA